MERPQVRVYTDAGCEWVDRKSLNDLSLFVYPPEKIAAVRRLLGDVQRRMEEKRGRSVMGAVCSCGHSKAEHNDSRGWCISFSTPDTMRCPCRRWKEKRDA